METAAPRRRQQCQRLEAIRRSLLSWTRGSRQVIDAALVDSPRIEIQTAAELRRALEDAL